MKTKKGLLLINLGTPDDPGYLSVFKYLRQFLMDPKVITVPYILRFILVSLIIVPFMKGTMIKETRINLRMYGTVITFGSIKNCLKYLKTDKYPGSSGVPRLISNSPFLVFISIFKYWV